VLPQDDGGGGGSAAVGVEVSATSIGAMESGAVWGGGGGEGSGMEVTCSNASSKGRMG
jgi:hypothetical protein